MSLFTLVEDAHVVVCRQGVFHQCDVYQRGGRLYAQLSRSSFVGLRDNRSTTNPKVYWDFIDIEYDIERVSGAIILRVGVKPKTMAERWPHLADIRQTNSVRV